MAAQTGGGTAEPTQPNTSPPEKAPVGATPPAPAASSRPLNLWTFLSIAIVMVALAVIIWKVLDASNPDSSVAVLGVIIPIFATIGAAVFGIPIAYQRGADQGTQTATAGKQHEIADAADKAKKDGQRTAKSQMQPVVRELVAGVNDLVGRVRTASTSPPGTDNHVLGLLGDQTTDQGASAEARLRALGADNDALIIPNPVLTNLENQAAILNAMVQPTSEA
jgi:hypothetical protein